MKKGVVVRGHESKVFWNGITIRSDIVIEKGKDAAKQTFIIDTKWKNISYSQPSTDDLRQMYVYNEYWQSDQAMLLYPSNTATFAEKDFREFDVFGDKTGHHACGLWRISIFKTGTTVLDEGIEGIIIDWFEKRLIG